jgi:hypothetical protein
MVASSNDSIASSSNQLRVVASVKDLSTNAHFLKFKFTTIDGGKKSELVKRSWAGQPQNIAQRLLDCGAKHTRGFPDLVVAIKAAIEEFDGRAKPAMHYVTQKTGWVGDDFVLIDRTFGPRRGCLSFKRTDDSLETPTRGTVDDWIAGLREACLASSFLTFSLATAYSGPLMALVEDDEGAIFHNAGGSTGGKSLAIRAAISVIKEAPKSKLTTYDLTPRALEELCYRCNDLMVGLDEYARLEGSGTTARNNASRIACTVASGAGKKRSDTAANLPNLDWRTLALSCGEVSLKLPPGMHGGEGVRLIEIPVPDAKQDAGIFDRIDKSVCNTLGARQKRAAELAAQVENTISKNFGVAIRKYLKILTQNKDESQERAKRLMALFLNKVELIQTAWEKRYANKFALIYAGAVLAARFGVAPWSEADAARTVRRVYLRARAQTLSGDDAACFLARRLMKAKTDRKLPRVGKGKALPQGAIGFQREVDGEDCIAISTMEASKLIAFAPIDGIIDTLDRRSALVRGKDGKSTRQIQVLRAAKGRFLCIRADCLDALLNLRAMEWTRM